MICRREVAGHNLESSLKTMIVSSRFRPKAAMFSVVVCLSVCLAGSALAVRPKERRLHGRFELMRELASPRLNGPVVPWLRQSLNHELLFSGFAPEQIGRGQDWLTIALDRPLPEFPGNNYFRMPGAWASDTQCLMELAQEGVRFELAHPTNGITTPVILLESELGGVLYTDYFRRKRAVPMDCRLALSLARAGAVMRRLGVTEILWSSVYRPVLPDPDKIPENGYNMHQQALAIDVLGVRFGERMFLVSDHYERGLGRQSQRSCVGRPITRQGLLLRMLVCDLDASDLFSSILTPDFDDGHWNHFHMAVYHPRDRWKRRFKRTVLMEVDIHSIPDWAASRPMRADPTRKRWEEVASRPWPVVRRWLSEELAESVARFRARQDAPRKSPAKEIGEDWLSRGFNALVSQEKRNLLGRAFADLLDSLENAF